MLSAEILPIASSTGTDSPSPRNASRGGIAVSCSSVTGGRAITDVRPGLEIARTVSAKSCESRSSGSTVWPSPSTSTSVACVASST